MKAHWRNQAIFQPNQNFFEIKKFVLLTIKKKIKVLKNYLSNYVFLSNLSNMKF